MLSLFIDENWIFQKRQGGSKSATLQDDKPFALIDEA